MSEPIGVVIVTFNSAPVIAECLESVFASRGADVAVVVVDNDSTDSTVQVIEDWASGRVPLSPRDDCPIRPLGPVAKPVRYTVSQAGDVPAEAPLVIVRSAVNGGFAHGVNRGLEVLARRKDVSLFWVLNPDCVVPPGTAAAYLAAAAEGPFSLIGCRTIYYEHPDRIETDGGTVNRWTGVCSSVHARQAPDTPLPDARELDYVTGANMVASRTFLEAAGPMAEDYFLYYEEVDWASRRGNLPLKLVDGAVVYHHGGTAIGSGTAARRASPFANYFNYRNRRLFARRHLSGSGPIILVYALLKAAQLFLMGARDEARAILAGAFLRPPPPDVKAKVKEGEARRLAFGAAHDQQRGR
jgi:GT2 family glycosyltransferase